MLLPDSQQPLIIRSPNGTYRTCDQITGVGVLAGAFNPLHRGHLMLRQQAEQILGCDVIFEFTVDNADKAAVHAAALPQRLSQFSDASVALTAAPRFADKALLFPGCCFVVGFDTAVRLLDLRFYDHCTHVFHQAFDQMRALGNRFLVAGRLRQQPGPRTFLQMQDLTIPPRLADMFTGLDECDFREDISSTELRGD